MQYKTSELTGALLDAAVAKAEGRLYDLHLVAPHGVDFLTVVDPEQSGWVTWSPSRLWEDGGPIIERERIASENTGSAWRAAVGEPLSGYELPDEVLEGATPLIAAMRSYVAYKLGHFVEL